jgi:hypothetical protein
MDTPGDVLWSRLITKKLSCPKDYGSFTTCTMELESYGYQAKDVFYELKDGRNSFGSG